MEPLDLFLTIGAALGTAIMGLFVVAIILVNKWTKKK